MIVDLKEDEVAAIEVDKANEEHERFQWRKPEEVVIDNNIHPGIRQYAQDLMAFMKNKS